LAFFFFLLDLEPEVTTTGPALPSAIAPGDCGVDDGGDDDGEYNGDVMAADGEVGNE
jgi:hypothetical protein